MSTNDNDDDNSNNNSNSNNDNSNNDSSNSNSNNNEGESGGGGGDGWSPTINEGEPSGVLMLASEYPKKRAGRKKFKETRHPVYRGVRQRSSGKWVSEVRQPNKKERIWLGTYLTADMAARAHDVAAIALRGRQGACLNFADSVWRLPVPASSDTKDIQKAAAEAAEAFKPSASGAAQSLQQTETVPPPDEGLGEMEQSGKDVEYVDDDMVFGMPELLSEMYQGLVMSPPRHLGGSTSFSHDPRDDGGGDGDDEFENADVQLWSYSI
ncbi:hypothetical protein vseg_001224 [Gypsophila vaccaria]